MTDLPTGARVRVQPGFVGIVVLLAACGASLRDLAGGWGYEVPGMAAYVAVFTAALLVLIAVHEAGHLLAAQLQGHRLVSVRIGMKFGITMHGDHTPTSTAYAAAAGPVIGSLAAIAVLALTPAWSPLWAAAGVALVENLGNALFFFVPGSDGHKIATGLRRQPATVSTLPVAVPTPTREAA